MPKLRIAIIMGSTRPGRFNEHPAQWIHKVAAAREDLDVQLLDLRDYPMPFFDEESSPAYKRSESDIARRWQKKVAEFDGYIVVTAEYNRGPAAVLKNALDYAYNEWNNKPVAFVGYGSAGGARAIEQLRLNAIELQMAPIRTAVHIQWPIYLAVTKEGKALESFEFLQQGANDMIDQLLWWASALKAARSGATEKLRLAG